jgi:hypothetical protein
MGGPLESIRDWMRSGELCFVARVNGRIAHSNLSSWHRHSDQQPIRLLPNEVYTTEGSPSRSGAGGPDEAILSCVALAQNAMQARVRSPTGEDGRGGGWSVECARGHHLFVSSRASNEPGSSRWGCGTDHAPHSTKEA